MARKVFTDIDKKLPEATAKKFSYTGPEGVYRFIHLGEEFCLGDITTDKADQLIKDGFEYLTAVTKQPKEA
jgi:hypothetical protein